MNGLAEDYTHIKEMKKLLYLFFLSLSLSLVFIACEDPYDLPVNENFSPATQFSDWYEGEWLDLTIDGKKVNNCKVFENSRRSEEYDFSLATFPTKFHIFDYPKKEVHIIAKGVTVNGEFRNGYAYIRGGRYKVEATHQIFPERRDSARLTLVLTRYEK